MLLKAQLGVSRRLHARGMRIVNRSGGHNVDLKRGGSGLYEKTVIFKREMG